MKRSVLSIALLGLTMVSVPALAAPYGMAGCGVGAMVFKDQPGKIQIVSATLNNIISPQTSAITSGTSNCYEDSTTAGAMFINVNEVALRKDISRGTGESVASLSKIMKCSDSDLFASTLQKNYSVIFPSEDVSAEQINSSIQSMIRENADLSKSCKVTG